VSLPRTPSQTVGPYYAIGLCRHPDQTLDPDGVELTGELLDGEGIPIPDGMIELWDATARAWGRCGTHPSGRFSFRVREDAEALEGYVFARGLLKHQRFRVFPGELPRDSDGRLMFDIQMQGDHQTVFYET
jgi:protocatechuate 3,4-dioxygenase alpha subunit